MKEILTNSEWIFSALSILVAGILTNTMSRFLFKKEKDKKPSDMEKIFTAIDRKFDSDLIKSKYDIEIILNSISRNSENIYSLAPILEDYITYRLDSKLKEDNADSSKISERYNLLKGIIQEENKEKPFDNVPDEERRMLVGIKDGIHNKDMQSLEFNLHELHTVISTRTRIYERTNKLNRWSIPLAIIGTFFTILFGILSLTPNIDSKKIEEMNNNILEKIEMLNASDTTKTN